MDNNNEINETDNIGHTAESYEQDTNSLPKSLLEWKLLRRFKDEECLVTTFRPRIHFLILFSNQRLCFICKIVYIMFPLILSFVEKPLTSHGDHFEAGEPEIPRNWP